MASKSGTIFSHFLLTDDWDTAKAQIDAINVFRDGEKKKKEEETAASQPPEPEHPGEDENKEDL